MTTMEITAAPEIAAVAAVKQERRASLFSAYSQLSKARLSTMVLITTAVGYMLAPWVNAETGGWRGLLWTIVGTGFLAAAASAFNQVMEIERDGMMDRTKKRPLPSGRISLLHGFLFGFVCMVIGAGVLVEMTTPLTAGLGLFTVVLYALVYTPLKSRTSLNTIVGAVVGAIPPMMGWAAAEGGMSLSGGAWLMGCILFIWQIPHFLALAWLYRGDYVKGGYRMLPVIDPSGRLTCRLIVVYSMALLPLGPAAMIMGITGWVSAVFSVVLGAVMVAAALNLSKNKTRDNARKVFLLSVVYLPLLMLMMVMDSQQGGRFVSFRGNGTVVETVGK
jgi:protoheme IX farnesyltransferase